MIFLIASIVCIANAIYYSVIWENLSRTTKRLYIFLLFLFGITGLMFDKLFPKTTEALEAFWSIFAGLGIFSLILNIYKISNSQK